MTPYLKTCCDKGPVGARFPIPSRHATQMFKACEDCRPSLSSPNGANIGVVPCDELAQMVLQGMSSQRYCVVHVVSTTWANRILEGDVDPQTAFHFAEAHPQWLRSPLQTAAYYMFLAERDLRANKPPQTDVLARVQQDPRLNQEQKSRLVHGHHMLSEKWKAVSAQPPSLARHTPECAEAKCNMIWQRRWDAAGNHKETLRYSQVDVLGRLRCMRNLLERGLLVDDLGFFQCLNPAFAALEEAIDRVEKDLESCFF